MANNTQTLFRTIILYDGIAPLTNASPRYSTLFWSFWALINTKLPVKKTHDIYISNDSAGAYRSRVQISMVCLGNIVDIRTLMQ